MNLFGQTTTLSSRHTVKMAWLRIDRIVRDPLTASCHARGRRLLLRRRHGRDLWIETGAHGTSTWIDAFYDAARTTRALTLEKWASNA